MPVLCCGSSSVQVNQMATRSADTTAEDDSGTDNQGESQESEVAEDPEVAEAVPGQSNGLVKSSAHKMMYEVNPDPDTTATSTGKDSSTRASKKGRKLPKKKGSLAVAADGEEGDHSSEKAAERSISPKKKNGKKASLRETEEMEMNPLDPGFYNSATLQASRQLYSQQTFEEEDEEWLDSMEEERRKNKHRQRVKKKQGSSAAPVSGVDPMQAAYERAQQEIDKVLGPRTDNLPSTVSGANGEDRDKRSRSRRRNKRGEVNEGYRQEETVPAVSLQPSESLEEVKSRVHALLDDAFSLLSNSYTSIGSAKSERSRSFKRNRVAPVSPSRQAPSESPVSTEPPPPLTQSPAPASMPAVEEVLDTGLAPKPGEKLHTPVLVERTYGDYDAEGLITWSPYRAADESARIVLPQVQLPSSKAPVQEKVQTTTFLESATPNGAPSTHSAQSLVLHTRQPPPSAPRDPESRPSEKAAAIYAATAESDGMYTPYPGLEAYEEMMADTTTTTALFTVPPASSPREAAVDDPPAVNGEVSDTPPEPPAYHTPPTRNVGTRDERDFIASSLGAGTSPKDLVDSIRQELQSLSGKVPQEEASNSRRGKLSKPEASNGHHDRLAKTNVSRNHQDRASTADVTRNHQDRASATDVTRNNHERASTTDVTRNHERASATDVTRNQRSSTTDVIGGQGGIGNGSTKPLKRPRKSSYLDTS